MVEAASRCRGLSFSESLSEMRFAGFFLLGGDALKLPRSFVAAQTPKEDQSGGERWAQDSLY